MKQTINLNAELLHVISSHINTPYTESNQATHKRVSAAHSSGLWERITALLTAKTSRVTDKLSVMYTHHPAAGETRYLLRGLS